MNPRLPKSVLLPLAAGLVQILSGCMSSTVNDPDKSAGGSDEIDTRIAVDRTGRPVVSARIALVRTDDSTGKPVAVNATGTDGSFPKFVVPDGFYSVVLRDPGDSLGKYVDSVQVKNQKVPAGRDTLLALGSVSGVVRVSAGHSPVTVSVGLVGTDILATVKTDGTFRIELVPGGIYTLGAFPMLDGYGPLYLRIQLKDGQNLTLSDTLLMPFTGLPAPGAMRVLQDTGTGNVRLSWNRVDHPDLLGYVVDRVEGGAVTASRYLTDTTWTDSLGASWEAMPLLGPWPAREVAYRVRSRSLSGSPDSKSAAQALTAKAPEWTKRVDSVRVTMTTDSVTGVTTLEWNMPNHPDIKGWNVSRLVDGTPDCSVQIPKGHWDDSSCPDLAWRPVESFGVDSVLTPLRMFASNNLLVTYSIAATRRIVGSETVFRTSRQTRAEALAAWRDSAIGEDALKIRFASFGRWLAKRQEDSKRVSLSRDGIGWEPIPHSFERIIGIEDSVWTVSLDTVSNRLTVHARTQIGSWVSRTIALSFAPVGLGNLSVRNGNLVVGFELPSKSGSASLKDDTLLEIRGDSLSEAKIGGFGSFLSWDMSYKSIPVNEKLRVDEIYGISGLFLALVEFGEVRLRFHSRRLGGLVGLVGEEGGMIVGYDNDLAYLPVSGEAKLIPLPTSMKHTQGFGEMFSSRAVFRDEIWTIIDGHLWKGKLNLPK